MGWRVKQCKWWLLLMWVLLSVPLGAEAAGRVALVIGNSGYAERPLKNPPNDARAMAALLQKLGFSVTEKTDLTLAGFRQQVNTFLDQSKSADLRLFYYSGHGASYDGDNYLLPIGHGVTRKHELPDQAYSLKTLLRGLKDQGGINLVLLDSCRDAPFGDAKSIWDDSKGMKPIQPQEGVLIGYAAQNGRTASDNSGGGNSLYTKYLLQELGQSLELREALMRVRQGVYDESRGEQRPTTEDEVLGKVHLAEAPPAPREPPPVTSGTLVIRNSQPPGAVISVDGNRLGAAPQTATLKAGQHMIEARQAGYADYRDTVQVRAGEQTVLNVVLTALPREPAPVERPRPAPVARTGQRFTDNGDGTVTDNRTGLIWLKDANCFRKKDWPTAMDLAKGLKHGQCDLRDGSVAGQWRLPSKEEWEALVDETASNLALPAGHPFAGVRSVNYWSSTTNASNPSLAWVVVLSGGYMGTDFKTGYYYVWPVRGRR